jgi:hypothetical protein
VSTKVIPPAWRLVDSADPRKGYEAFRGGAWVRVHHQTGGYPLLMPGLPQEADELSERTQSHLTEEQLQNADEAVAGFEQLVAYPPRRPTGVRFHGRIVARSAYR